MLIVFIVIIPIIVIIVPFMMFMMPVFFIMLAMMLIMMVTIRAIMYTPAFAMITNPVIKWIIVHRPWFYAYLYQYTIPAIPVVTLVIVTHLPHMPAGSLCYFKSQTDISPITTASSVIIIFPSRLVPWFRLLCPWLLPYCPSR